MKLRVGGKYRMRNYPTKYLYVLIIANESEFGLADVNARSYYNSSEGIDLYAGIIIYENNGLNREPELLSWGEDGSWDGAFLQDNNALVEEVE